MESVTRARLLWATAIVVVVSLAALSYYFGLHWKTLFPVGRLTARISLVLLLGAFFARGKERTFLSAMAIPYGVHGWTFLMLGFWTHGQHLAERGPFVVATGAFAYVLLALVVAWRRAPDGLVGLTMAYLWVVFAVSYTRHALFHSIAYLLALVGLAAALGYRVIVTLRRAAVDSASR
jgi:hypothetical protein